ncbi:MAG: HPr family phosphocarrier protein, partial [Mesorhizobium sp.]
MERSTIVRVHEGLHARPATRFVKLAKGFESEVELVKDGKAVSAKSSVKLMLLAVKENQEVTVRANGADAIEAIEALIGYLENPRAGLDDEGEAGEGGPETAAAAPEAAPLAAAPTEGTPKLQGVAASEGVAIGPAFAHFPPDVEGPGRHLQAGEIEGELERFRGAVASIEARMDRTLAENNLSAGDRGIVAALRDIAADDSLTGEVERLINGGDDAVSAVIAAASTIAADFSAV